MVMVIHLKPRQNLYRRLSALSLNSTNTVALVSPCADSGETASENRVFYNPVRC